MDTEAAANGLEAGAARRTADRRPRRWPLIVGVALCVSFGISRLSAEECVTGTETRVGLEERDNRIEYIEFEATDIAATKEFYSAVFGWCFTDYGPEYTSFEEGRLAGGFAKADNVETGGPLIVIYATDLPLVETKVEENGGTIVKAIFEFPGGKRFHFADPSGNLLAVWSE